jgi:hypothetical protein
MVEVIGASLIFMGLAYAENKGWVDKEKFRFVLSFGMNAGIMISLFYFFHLLSKSFL